MESVNEQKIEKKANKFISRTSEALISLVSRGNSILCELLRLKDYIPDIYINPSGEDKKFKDIIFDFSYVTSAKDYEEKVRNSTELRNKDEEFKENNLDIIERFYGLFDSINTYITDWSTFVEQVNKGVYVQTIDNILQNKETCKLLCESIFLPGVMLLLVDRLIPGISREKILISAYRYKGQTTIANFDRLIEIFKKTGYTPASGTTQEEIRPKNYPVDYFSNLKLDHSCVLKIIGKLKEMDIYDQVESFPNGEHKAHALSGQAAMLFVTLFFAPEYLEEKEPEMRNIGDQYFNDNWVLAVYMGYTFDISDYWKDYKAARKALDLNLNVDTVKGIKDKYNGKLMALIPKIKKELADGNLSEDYVLRKIENLLELMRDSNVVLKWFLLQRQINGRKYKDIINSGFKPEDLIDLLLILSQFEYLLKEQFSALIAAKLTKATEDKNECSRLLKENYDLFGGKISIGTDLKNEQLEKVFQDNMTILEKLNFSNSSSCVKNCNKIISALEEIKTNYRIESNAQVKSNVQQLLLYLNHINLLMNLKKRYLINISRISDFSYAWISIQDYQSEMQQFLRQDTKAVLLLRATFLKLASILNFPLVRLFEMNSPDIESVTNYYSGELIKFVKNVLQIIPNSVFNILKTIINVFKKNSMDLPIKIMKDQLDQHIRKEDRHLLAKATHKISLFTQGILMMKRTLMGIIEIDPKQILEEGIRKELLNLIAREYHNSIDYIPGSNIDLMGRLNELNIQISCIKKSFIYIQDYININGNRMWGEEMHKLVNYYVHLEASKFVQKKQIKEISDKSIIRFPPLPKCPDSETFLGRLTNYIIYLSNPKTSNFSPANFAWFDFKEKEVFGIRTLNMIKEAMGIEGFQGVSKLLNYRNYYNIIELQSQYQKLGNDSNTNIILRNITKVIGSPCTININEKEPSIKLLFNNVANFTKTKEIMNNIVSIGHIEFLRKLQYYSLTENVEVDSYTLTSEIQALNNINLHILNNFFNIKFNVSDDESNKQFNNHNYYKRLCDFFNDFGFLDTRHTFYYNLTSAHDLPLILAITTYNELTNYYSYDKKTEKIKKIKGDDFDLFYFTQGVYSVLYQMGRNNMILFISLLSLLMRNHLLNQYTLKDYKGIYDTYPEVQKNVAIIQMFLQSFKINCDIDLKSFDINFNSYFMFRNIAN